MNAHGRLRVAMVAGTLGPGGAEKQLVYMAGALRKMDAEVIVCSLTRGEHFESALAELGIEPVWVGRFSNPVARSVAIASVLAPLRPHIVQSAHFYTNLYVSLAAPVCGSVGVGTARSDVIHDMSANGRWGRWLLRTPDALIVNSHAARQNAVAAGIPEAAVSVLPNVIDLRSFDELAEREPIQGSAWWKSGVVVAGIGTLIKAKRFDRFLHALALARSRGADIHGILVGDGPMREDLEALAESLGLLPDGARFLGRSADVPALLRRAHIFLLTSEHEGFPNVLIEAMAAGLPAIATPAGDAGGIVQDGVTGFVVPMDDEEAIAARLVELAASRSLRARLGDAGRLRVEERYSDEKLADRLIAIYRDIALRVHHNRALAVLPA